MEIKIVQSIYTIKYGMLESKRVIEVDDLTGQELINAKFAVLNKEQKVTKVEDVKAADEQPKTSTAKKPRGSKSTKKETEEIKGEE